MTGIGGGFDASLARMMAQAQIDSERVNLQVVRGTHKAAQAELHVKHAAKENANDLASAMSYVNIAMSAVKVASSAQSLGTTIDSTQNLQQGMNNPGTATGDYAALKEVRLPGGGGDRVDQQLESLGGGREGMTVGDRFTDGQLDVLTGRTQPSTLSDQALRDRGFSNREIGWLRSYGADGLSQDEGIHFMMQHPSPEHGFRAQQMETITGAREGRLPDDATLRQQGFSDEQIRGLHDLKDGRITQDQFMSQNAPSANAKEMIRAGLVKALTETMPERMVTNAQEDAQRQGKRSDEAKGIMDEVANALRDNISSHKKKLLDLELSKIEQQGGQNAASRR